MDLLSLTLNLFIKKIEKLNVYGMKFQIIGFEEYNTREGFAMRPILEPINEKDIPYTIEGLEEVVFETFQLFMKMTSYKANFSRNLPFRIESQKIYIPKEMAESFKNCIKGTYRKTLKGLGETISFDADYLGDVDFEVDEEMVIINPTVAISDIKYHGRQITREDEDYEDIESLIINSPYEDMDLFNTDREWSCVSQTFLPYKTFIDFDWGAIAVYPVFYF